MVCHLSFDVTNVFWQSRCSVIELLYLLIVGPSKLFGKMVNHQNTGCVWKSKQVQYIKPISIYFVVSKEWLYVTIKPWSPSLPWHETQNFYGKFKFCRQRTSIWLEMITNQITSLLVVELTTEPNPNKFLESKIFSVGVLSNYYGAQNKPGLALLSFNTIIPHGLHNGA